MSEELVIIGTGAPRIENEAGTSTLVDFSDFGQLLENCEDKTKPPTFYIDHFSDDGKLKREGFRITPKYELKLKNITQSEWTSYFAQFKFGETVRFFPKRLDSTGILHTHYQTCHCVAQYKSFKDNGFETNEVILFLTGNEFSD